MIDYDRKNKNTRKRVYFSKEGVFKTGKTVSTGYSNLYEDIDINMNLEVKIIPCYAKGAGSLLGQKFHALEAIILTL